MATDAAGAGAPREGREDAETQEEYARSLQDKVQGLEAHRAKLGEDVDQFTSLVNAMRSKEAGYTSNLARLAGPVATDTADAGKDTPMGGKGMGGVLSKMLKDPAMKEMMAAQQKVMVQKMYGPLLKELNLTPEQNEAFQQIVLEHQMSAADQAFALMGEGDAGKTDAVNKLKDKEKGNRGRPESGARGGEGTRSTADYKTTLGERMQLDRLRQQLEDGTTPLQDAQTKALLQVMKEERERVPPVVPTQGSGNAAELSKLLTAEAVEKQMEWQADLGRRVQERAAQILSPEQLKEFADAQAQQLNLQRVGIKMARELFGSGKGAPGAGDPASILLR